MRSTLQTRDHDENALSGVVTGAPIHIHETGAMRPERAAV